MGDIAEINVDTSEIKEMGESSLKAHGCAHPREGHVEVEETEALPNKKFFMADPQSDWYKHLLTGRCKDLLDMVINNPGLVWQKGKGNVTVLHKAVHHQHVALVGHVVGMFDDKGIFTHSSNQLTLEDLLCEKDDREITAVMLAAVIGPWDGMHVFSKAIVKCDRNAYEVDPFDYHTSCSVIVDNKSLQVQGEGDVFECLANNSRALKDSEVKSRVEKRFEECCKARKALRTNTSLYQDEIQPIVKTLLGSSDADITSLKEEFERRDDYNGAPTEKYFFHFLCGCFEPYLQDGLRQFRWKQSAERVARMIVDKIKEQCSSPKDRMFDLFDYLDPQGRTALHVAGMAGFEVRKKYKIQKFGVIKEVLGLIPKDNYERCVNVRDGGGRTIFHQACILNNSPDFEHLLEDARVDFNARVDLNSRANWFDPLVEDDNSKFKGDRFGRLAHLLLHWRSPRDWIAFEPLVLEEEFYPAALHLLILHGHDDFLGHLLESKGQVIDVNALIDRAGLKTPVKLAAALGREKMVHLLLKHKKVKDNGKLRGPHDKTTEFSAIHVAAEYKRSKVLQALFGMKEIYDPMIAESYAQCTPFHLIASPCKSPDLITLDDTLLEGGVNSIQRCLHKCKGRSDDLHKNYDANDIVCINILFQVEFDKWCTTRYGEFPCPGVHASMEAYKWWYDRVASEVANFKQKMNGTISALSIIATLVATTSFIGPLQPPLGFDHDDGYGQSRHFYSAYFMLSGCSFYFAVASLLIAMTPVFPMQRESIQDEIWRNRRNFFILQIAMWLLFVSISCLLLSFLCSSIAVARLFDGKHRKVAEIISYCACSVCFAILFLSMMLSLSIKRSWLLLKSLVTKRLGKTQ